MLTLEGGCRPSGLVISVLRSRPALHVVTLLLLGQQFLKWLQRGYPPASQQCEEKKSRNEYQGPVKAHSRALFLSGECVGSLSPQTRDGARSPWERGTDLAATHQAEVESSLPEQG